MAHVTGGPGAHYSGTVDGMTYSKQKDGRTTVKKCNGPSTKPPTAGQLANRQKIRIVNEAMKPFAGFVKIGYALEAELKGCNAYNAMSPYVKTLAITGQYPLQRIDYAKMLITKGQMEKPADVTFMAHENGVVFSWNTDMKMQSSHFSDQVLMLAYFPELGEVSFLAAGAQRHKGTDLLDLRGTEKGSLAHLFVAFAANDRKGISDSVYVGQLDW